MLNRNNEIWKDIPEYEGRYQASNLGRIRSIQSNHGKYQEVIKATYIRSDTCQYEYFQTSEKGVSRSMAVHRAVAQAFIPNPENKPMVNHLDGDKLNNHVDNLEWVTCSENHKHAYASGMRNADSVAEKHRGQKIGLTSKYHNVSWDKSRNKWKATLKDKGKMIFQKRFDCEIEAAKHVNFMLDSLGYDNRPRNIIS